MSKRHKGRVLPEWFRAEIPEPKPVVTIAWVGDHVEASGIGEFPSVMEAYDAIYDRDDSYDIVLDKSIDGHGGRLRGSVFLCDAEDEQGNSRGLLSRTDDERLEGIMDDYCDFMDHTNPAYEQDPEDWVTAYHWLNTHPATWFRNQKGKDLRYWVTNEGLNSLSVYVSRDQSGKPFVHFEFGAHDSTYQGRSYEPRLSVRAESFERGYVELARKFNMFYSPDGSQREDVQYEKSAEELSLEKIVRESLKR